MITVKVETDMMSGDRLITARVPLKDLIDIKLDDFDKAVLNQPEETAADIFQSLELLARRQAQQGGQ